MDPIKGEQDDSMFKCFECGKEFASLGEFERHDIEFHTDETRNAKSHSRQQQSRNASEAIR
jgi:hypothetical protein